MPAAVQGYELRGARLFFQFHAFAHGAMPEILYVNGSRTPLSPARSRMGRKRGEDGWVNACSQRLT
jgi:hypothetical protein